jgi:glycerol-3-phosphate dehydrogenase (NAD(P)+)
LSPKNPTPRAARRPRTRPVDIVVTGPKVTVLGAGSWGTTFAKILADGGADVTLWARRPELALEIAEARRNSDYLPGINLPRNVTATAKIGKALDGAEQVYISVPSQTLRENLTDMRDALPPTAPLISLMKGVEKGTGLRMSQVIQEVLAIDPSRVAVASGPNLALEIAREQPTAAVVSSESLETAQAVAMVCRNRYFRSFVNTDVIGTEFGGVLKNLIAVAIGIVDGVGYGENTKASIITRGLVEMTDFAVAFGAHPDTLAGLAGLGDLIATCQSPLSRNNTAGRLLGQGYSFNEVIKQMNQTAEGLASVAPILVLARAKGVEMPIVEQVSQVLAGTLDPKDIAPHLTTDSDSPQGERTTDDGQTRPRASLWRSLQRTLDQLRDGGRGSRGN